MLPFILGGAAVLLVGGYILDEVETASRQKHRKKLEKQKKTYKESLYKKEESYAYHKQKTLFHQIKHEQTVLKKERCQLYGMRNKVSAATEQYRMLQKEIDHLSYLIEMKQKDADKVKLMMAQAPFKGSIKMVPKSHVNEPKILCNDI